jgi:PAS domain S-box-containing protein
VIAPLTDFLGSISELHLLGILALCLLQSMLIAALLVNRSRRQRAERALRASEQRYRDVVQSQTELVCRYLPDTTLTFVNDAYCRFFGRSRSDLLGRRFLDLVPEKGHAGVEAVVNAAIASGQAQTQEHEVLTPDGEIVWQRWTDRPIPDEQGVVRELQGIGVDITARKRSEDALRESEARARAVLRAIPDLMFLQDGAGVYLDYHARDPAALLLPPERFLGRPMSDVLPPELAERFQDAFDRASATGGPVVLEYDIEIGGDHRHFEARTVPCDPGRVLSIVRDTTDRVRAERDAREARERYALATAAGRVGVWEWTVDSGVIVVDAALREMLSFEVDGSVDAWAERLHPDDRDRVSALARACIEGRSTVFESEQRLRVRDEYIWLLSRGMLQGHRAGQPRRMLGTCIDVSERRHAEEALQRAQADVARLNRLTSMGELAASIAHEVNQPLCAIIANAQAGLRTLRTDGALDVELIRGAFGDIVTDGKRASDVISRTRQLFTERGEEKALVDLNDIVRSVGTLAGRTLDTNSVRADFALHPELPLVLADPVLLKQVVLNLIMNAVDAMSASERRHLALSTSCDEEGVKVAVTDSGRGLHPDQAQEIFQAFYTTKPDGMGMGLAISRAIVVAHGGRLWGTANTDHGATFQFVIPTAGLTPSLAPEPGLLRR